MYPSLPGSFAARTPRKKHPKRGDTWKAMGQRTPRDASGLAGQKPPKQTPHRRQHIQKPATATTQWETGTNSTPTLLTSLGMTKKFAKNI